MGWLSVEKDLSQGSSPFHFPLHMHTIQYHIQPTLNTVIAPVNKRSVQMLTCSSHSGIPGVRSHRVRSLVGCAGR